MNLENQVCSLELSKRLKNLGVKQKSLFCWCGEKEHIKIMLNEIYDRECNPHYKLCSAFTVAELGKMIPWSLGNEDYLFISKLPNNSYNTYYHHPEHGLSYYGVIFKDENLANCFADMLIYSVEKKLINVWDINNG